MATKTLYLSGVAQYVQVKTPSKDYDNYAIGVSLDDNSVKLLKESGSQATVKDDNLVYFRRPHSKTFKNSPEPVVFGPPKLFDENENSMDDKDFGPGSEVIVKVAVYEAKKGKGTRLEAVKVTNLVASTYGNAGF